MHIQQCCALYENNNGFPRLLTPRELSRSVVSNVEQRAPTPSSKLLCVRSHLSRNLDIGAAVDTFIVLRRIVLFSLSTQPQFSLSFTCKLLNDLLCTIRKICHAYGRQNPCTKHMHVKALRDQFLDLKYRLEILSFVSRKSEVIRNYLWSNVEDHMIYTWKWWS